MRRIEADQMHAHERRGAEVERLGFVGRRDALGLRAPLRGRQRLEIGVAPRAAQRRVDRLRDAVWRFVESGAQRFVARDQRIAGEPQRMRIQRPVEREPLGDVIRVRRIDQPRVQPQPRLRERCRDAIVARRARRDRQPAEIDPAAPSLSMNTARCASGNCAKRAASASQSG
jgi:hypothetical protein